MPFAAAISEHPLTAHAVGEVTGEVLEALGEHPDLALLFVTGPHAGALEDAATAVRTVLSPSNLIGCAAVSVVGTGREVEEQPGVVLWAAATGPVRAVALQAEELGQHEAVITGWPEQPLPFLPGALLLIADPFSFPADPFFRYLQAHYPDLPVVGGMASAARGPGGNRLVINDTVLTSGAVGAFLGPGVAVTPVVSQGCRPIGQPFTVTRSERNVIYELGGQPALTRLSSLLERELTPEDQDLVRQRALHVGIVLDEHKLDFEPGDFLVRNVLGGNRDLGAVITDEVIDIGATVQFQVRDAVSAHADLVTLLDDRQADSALMFTCNGRGTSLFAMPDHDAGLLAEMLGAIPTAGFFAAGEFGPITGRNFVHGFTASIALLSEQPTASG